jgi:hypothetical protein
MNYYWIQNTVPKNFIPNITDDDILYNRGIGLQILESDLSTKIKAGNYIVFQGDGRLEVIVEAAEAPCTVSWTDPDGTTQSMEITGSEILNIYPSTHRYVQQQSDGKYKIELNLNNVSISGATADQLIFDFVPDAPTDSTPKNKVLLDGGWQRAEDASPTPPTEAVKNVTVEACAKLKNDYGTNIRVYVIKYGDVTDPGNYIRDCASAPDYVRSASDAASLNTALQVIADDIKSFAGYEAAKNVQ